MFTEVKAQTDKELRAKVLNSLRAKTEYSEIKITQSGSDKVHLLRYTLSDLNPETVQIEDVTTSKPFDIKDLLGLGLNVDILSYSFFNTENPTPFGMDKKFHITYTAVKTSNNSLSHFLVYYDKKSFYPLKVTYFNGNKKVTTIEYLDYKKFRNKVWRAQVITSENHLTQKRTRVEFSKVEINSDPVKLRMGKSDSPAPN